MAYIALYRKYRSQTFGELMGQDAVTTVLQNSLRTGRIAHAYLFYGARGCGKTSTARLLSRALNCESQDGPTPEPCGTCRICTAIRDGACMDVIEIDAASETGVDNVREKIIENVQYVPTEARYKVYIIDEVHDLSPKAFDALLKTLEEPPPHVVFVLATTEQHKVPITIRSRCIPFQFKRGTLQDLSSAVQRVITAEGYTAQPEAVRSIARCAEGSWRDALSLLEQVISYSDTTITEDTVQRALGTVGSETLKRVVDTIASDSWSEVLAVAGELIDSGKDVRQLLTSLSGYLRDLLLISSGAIRAAEQELGPVRVEALTSQADSLKPNRLLGMLSILASAEKETRTNNQHRWLLERTLCMLLPSNLDLQDQSGRASYSGPAPQSTPVAPARSVSRPQTQPANPPTAIAEPRYPLNQRPTVVQVPTPPIRLNSVQDAESEPRPEDRFVGEITFDVVQRSWPRIVKAIEKISPSAGNYLEQAELCGLDGRVLVLDFADTFARDRIMNKGKTLVEKKINETLQSDGFRIRTKHEGGDGGIRPLPGGVPPTPTAAQSDAGKPGSSAPPAVSFLEEALDIFGGEVVRSEPTS